MTLSAPLRVTWDLTSRCNLCCRHCYNASSSQTQGPSPSALRTIAEKLSRTGIFFVSLSGGEPLMEPEIWNIIQEFKSRGKSIQLISNGTLITENVAQKIKDAKVDTVQISLDGLRETHEYQRGVKTCFEKSVEAITYLREKGVRVMVNTIVSQRNIGEIPELLAMVAQLGVNEFRVSRMILMGRGSLLEEEVLSKEQTRTLILYVLGERMRLKEKTVITPDECMSFLGEKIGEYGLTWQGCPAGRTECAVDALGYVYPCVFLCYEEFRMGNLLESDFDEVWHNEKFEDFRKVESACECEIKAFCRGGCPAASYGRYRNLRMKDPYCWRDG